MTVLRPVEHGHRYVEEEHQRDDDDAHLDDDRLLEVGAAVVVAEEVADDRDRRGDEEQPELNLCQHRRPDVALRLLRQEEIGRAEKAEQQPDDQRVGVDHAHDVEGQEVGRDEVWRTYMSAPIEAEGELEREDDERPDEVGERDALRRIFHGRCLLEKRGVYFAGFGAAAASSGCRPGGPAQELGHVVHVGVREVELRHLVPAFGSGRHAPRTRP